MATLRGFQPAAVAAALAQLVKPDRSGLVPGAATVLVLATGTGKTTIAGEIILQVLELLRALNDGRRVLWMVERIALVDQAWQSLRSHLPDWIRIGTEQGPRSAKAFVSLALGGDHVVVASVDTIRQGSRLSGLVGLGRRRPPSVKGLEPEAQRLRSKYQAELSQGCRETFAFVVVDEAHCGIENKGYHALYETLGEIPRLGLTATPYSSDGSAGMGTHWKSEAYQHSLADAIESGDLVPLRPYTVPLDSVDLEGINFNKENLTAAEIKAIEEAYKSEKALHEIAAVLAERVARPALVFCASTEHSKSLALAMARYDVTAEHTDCYQLEMVDGDDGERRRERDDILRRFKEGRIDFLFNFGLYVTGMDAPGTAAVVFVHPRNRRQCAQAIGRVTRWCCASAWNYGPCTCGRNKREGQVWDFYSETQMDHPGISGLVYALLPGVEDKEEIAELDAALKRGDEDPKKSVTEAKQIHADAARARARAASVKAQIKQSDLLDHGPLSDIETRLRWAGMVLPRGNGVRCTERQLDAVADLLFQDRATRLRMGPWRGALQANQAEAILRESKRRQANRLAPFRLIANLKSAVQVERMPDGTTRSVPMVAQADLRTMDSRRAQAIWSTYLASKGVTS